MKRCMMMLLCALLGACAQVPKNGEAQPTHADGLTGRQQTKRMEQPQQTYSGEQRAEARTLPQRVDYLQQPQPDGAKSRPQPQQADSAEQPVQTDGVEVLVFHTKRRCPTCLAIERLTREVVETEFARQLADGSLTLRIVRIEAERVLAERYEVVWSSLLLVCHRQGAERVCNLTQSAFTTARAHPDRFRAKLQTEIANLLQP